MTDLVMKPLARRLRQAGFIVKPFRYHSIKANPTENTKRLHRLVGALPGRQVHFVAHSLGGLIVRQLFEDFPEQPPGRIVTLGSPHQGSHVARKLASWRLLRPLLGQSREILCGHSLPPWQRQRELGCIAGTLSLGMGWLVPGMSRPNDGTVAVNEALLTAQADHTLVHASHMGMLVSKETAEQIIHFLKYGRFASPPNKKDQVTSHPAS